jgi:YbbR domain-containing protein
VNLITDDWRLKLLAVALAVLMLGAVAFSQNPTTHKTLTVPINYLLPDGLVLINPPAKTQVTVTGLADTVQSLTDLNLRATFNLLKANPGPSVQENLTVLSLVNDVKVQNPTVPFALNIDRLATVTLAVNVRVRAANGWEVTNSVALCPSAPCKVNFTGPSTWETNLSAVTDFPSPVANGSNDVLSQPILLLQNGTPLDTTRPTYPSAGLDVQFAAIHVDAKTGSSSRQVTVIDAPPTHGPPSGYRVTNITIDPFQVVITGAPDVISKVNTITLPAVDLSAYTTDITFRITIPYQAGVEGSVQIARVTYSISPNPNAQPTPT